MEFFVNEIEQDTFDSIKEVLESINLKELRYTNLEAAFEMGLKKKQQVRITYQSDGQDNLKTDGVVSEFDGKEVLINKSKKIPLRAIKKVEFYKKGLK